MDGRTVSSDQSRMRTTRFTLLFWIYTDLKQCGEATKAQQQQAHKPATTKTNQKGKKAGNPNEENNQKPNNQTNQRSAALGSIHLRRDSAQCDSGHDQTTISR